ncbi:MAG: SH3 domain-containing protein, partial [Patescibacteria group bacterium]
WVRTLEEFNVAGYNWADVQVISGPEFAELKISPLSATSATLFRKANDPKVYVQGANGALTWVKTIEEFSAAGYNWADVQVISGSEFARLGVKSSLGVKKGVNWLNIRKTPSLDGVIIGKMVPTDVYEKTGQIGVWFKINFKGQDGWIHSAYTVDK